MVFVVGDVETDELVVLSVLTLDERENETAVLIVVVLHLQRRLTRIFQPRIGQTLGITDGHRNILAHFQFRGVKVASTHENAHHVIDAVLILSLFPVYLSVSVDTVHLQVAVAIGITVPQLIYIVAVTFACALAEIEWRNIHVGIAQQRVAHHEHIV